MARLVSTYNHKTSYSSCHTCSRYSVCSSSYATQSGKAVRNRSNLSVALSSKSGLFCAIQCRQSARLTWRWILKKLCPRRCSSGNQASRTEHLQPMLTSSPTCWHSWSRQSSWSRSLSQIRCAHRRRLLSFWLLRHVAHSPWSRWQA